MVSPGEQSRDQSWVLCGATWRSQCLCHYAHTQCHTFFTLRSIQLLMMMSSHQHSCRCHTYCTQGYFRFYCASVQFQGRLPAVAARPTQITAPQLPGWRVGFHSDCEESNWFQFSPELHVFQLFLTLLTLLPLHSSALVIAKSLLFPKHNMDPHLPALALAQAALFVLDALYLIPCFGAFFLIQVTASLLETSHHTHVFREPQACLVLFFLFASVASSLNYEFPWICRGI